jgi:hypothetical protein
MSAGIVIPVAYDRFGRMKYHPDYHGKHCAPWTTFDEKFLIENYETSGPEQVSFALERTIQTVMARAYELRKAGRMSRSSAKRSYTKRSRGAA